MPKTGKTAQHSLLKKKAMNKGAILHLENEKTLLDGYQEVFDTLGIDLDFIPCINVKQFQAEFEKNKGRIKSVIFDLVGKDATAEELAGSPEFLNTINENFTDYNLPIFIFSSHLDVIGNQYANNGTVFKYSKNNSVKVVFEKIRFLLDSGFIDVFCPGGVLDKEIKIELNNSFRKQFSENSQVDDVINSIISSSKEEENKSERVKTVFKRITVKALSSDLLAPIADSEDKVHPIEHFYKRQSKLGVWTGDIWKQKNGEQQVLILTPRCDLANGSAKTLLYCIIEKPVAIELTGKNVEKNLRNFLTDNTLGKATRYIPSNVFFPEGGMVNLSLHETKIKEDFIEKYQYVITLSDDLTNEIIGKLAYYFLRTGITTINEQEFQAILKAMSTKV